MRFAALWVLLVVSSVEAQDFRFEGRAGTTRVVVSLESEEIRLALEGREAHRWPLAGPPAVTTRDARVGRRTLGIVEVNSGTRRFVALVDGRTLRWTGRLDPHGDPGERRRDVLQIADRTGDGVDDVIVGQIIEGRTLCGEDDTLLDPRAIHPRTGRLTSVTLRRLPESESGPLNASAEPLVQRPPLVRLLAGGASSASGHDIALTPPPAALVDGDAATAWIEASPGDGSWEFASFRWPARGVALRAFALSTPEVEGASAPRGVHLVFDSSRVHVTLPEGPGPWWVRLPEPVTTRCVSVVLDGARSGTHAALGEVAAYADVDFGEGLEVLIGRLGGGGTEASEAAELLTAIGAPVLPLLDERWAEMPSAEKRMVVGILARHATTELGSRGLLRAARDPEAEVRAAAVDRTIASEAIEVLAQMVMMGGEVGDRAALAFARRAPERNDVLLDALGREGGAARPALRDALRTSMQRGGDAARLDAWADTAGPASLSAAAYALAGGGERVDPLAHTLLVRAAASASAFEDRWRVIAATPQLSRELEGADTVDEFLRAQSRAEEWMTRSAALDALARRGVPDTRAIAEAALEDEYPRVRVAALRAFREIGSGPLRKIGLAARQDPWPMVRAAGVLALGSSEPVRPIVRASVGDPAAIVRAAAIGLLDPSDAEDWALIDAVLRDDDEWPNVIRSALEAASRRCRPDAIEALTLVAERGLRPDPWAPDVEVGAEAVGIAARIGGETARALIERAASETAPAPFRNVAEHAADAETCQAH